MELYFDIQDFFKELLKFLASVLRLQFIRFETKKGILVVLLYRQRGKMARRLTHSGMAGLTALGVMIAPYIAKEFPGRSVSPWEISSPSSVLSASTEKPNTSTIISDQRDQIIDYTVVEGDTLSSIAEKFGISIDSIRWQNDLKSRDDIKVGQILEILPVSGVSHKVQKGDTVYSIAKKYKVDPQAIVNFPFNTFTNDETFDLAIGQVLIVPGGVEPDVIQWSPYSAVAQITPNAGSVSGTGSFVWPTQGVITQYFVWYHPGVDIANASAPNVLAADSGRVLESGWDNSGYGNKVLIDHGNGYKTLYGHMQKLYVISGQTVNRGDAIGQMGSTGRSTGTHLHFEVYLNGVRINPLSVLR